MVEQVVDRGHQGQDRDRDQEGEGHPIEDRNYFVEIVKGEVQCSDVTGVHCQEVLLGQQVRGEVVGPVFLVMEWAQPLELHQLSLRLSRSHH